MKQILVKQGRYAGIEYPELLREAIGDITLDDWYKGDGFGYALGEVDESLAGSVIPSDFDITGSTEEYTTTEFDGDGEHTVTKTRVVRTALFNEESYNSRNSDNVSL